MNASQSIRDIFFEECEDLIDALSDGLDLLVADDAEAETVNAVFRAVHSIKGGAGAFGLEYLVSFAHCFETVLDKVRSDQLEATEHTSGLLRKAGDVLTDLVENARDGVEEKSEVSQAVMGKLEELLGENNMFLDEEVEEFSPLSLGIGILETEKAIECTVKFQPDAELYECANEPLYILEELMALGDCSCYVQVDHPDSFEEFSVSQPCMTWVVDFSETVNPAEIRSVFDFVEGACTIEITSPSAPLIYEDVDAPPVKNKELEKAFGRPKREVRDTLRVDVERIDRLINLVGELIVNQAMISQKITSSFLPGAVDLQAELDDYKQFARDIQEGVMSLRTQPVRPLFQKMLRIVRETSESLDKSIDIELEGEWTEVDKKVTEKLSDPLTHMIRNSVDHGIEDRETRINSGKCETGTIKLSAVHRSGNVFIKISDDGAGLNREKILSTAIEKNLIPTETFLSDSEIDELLFLPGFSTATEVTSLSGRGVGMDVVRTSICDLGGKIGIESTPGEGTTFTIQLPLTLAVLDGMIVISGGQKLVIPIGDIVEAIKPSERDVFDLEGGQKTFRYRDVFIRLDFLASCLGIENSSKKIEDCVVVIVETNGVLFALIVDEIREQRQVVIKGITSNYRDIEGISAATILGDGRIALIVDVDGIVEGKSFSSEIGG